MRLSKPRIEPLPESQWNDEQREIMAPLLSSKQGPGETASNIYATLLHHPKLMKRWLVFGNHVLFKSTLPARDRELAILRIGWLCRSGYEFCQHILIAKSCGVSDEEIEWVKTGPDAEGWSDRERYLIAAIDELHEDAFIQDSTYNGLKTHYGTEQIMDLVFAVGQYTLVSMVLNSFGVQLDADLADMWTLPVDD